MSGIIVIQEYTFNPCYENKPDEYCTVCGAPFYNSEEEENGMCIDCTKDIKTTDLLDFDE